MTRRCVITPYRASTPHPSRFASSWAGRRAGRTTISRLVGPVSPAHDNSQERPRPGSGSASPSSRPHADLRRTQGPMAPVVREFVRTSRDPRIGARRVVGGLRRPRRHLSQHYDGCTASAERSSSRPGSSPERRLSRTRSAARAVPRGDWFLRRRGMRPRSRSVATTGSESSRGRRKRGDGVHRGPARRLSCPAR